MFCRDCVPIEQVGWQQLAAEVLEVVNVALSRLLTSASSQTNTVRLLT